MEQKYDADTVQSAFGVEQKDFGDLVATIREIKRQRLETGHSCIQLRESTKLNEMMEIVKTHFVLTDQQLEFYQRILDFGIARLKQRYQQQNKDNQQAALFGETDVHAKDIFDLESD